MTKTSFSVSERRLSDGVYRNQVSAIGMLGLPFAWFRYALISIRFALNSIQTATQPALTHVTTYPPLNVNGESVSPYHFALLARWLQLRTYQ